MEGVSHRLLDVVALEAPGRLVIIRDLIRSMSSSKDALIITGIIRQFFEFHEVDEEGLSGLGLTED